MAKVSRKMDKYTRVSRVGERWLRVLWLAGRPALHEATLGGLQAGRTRRAGAPPRPGVSARGRQTDPTPLGYTRA
jgi:hypothetical protein